MMLMMMVGRKVVIRHGLILLCMTNSTIKPLRPAMSASQTDWREWLVQGAKAAADTLLMTTYSEKTVGGPE